jgi:hypothetical protein
MPQLYGEQKAVLLKKYAKKISFLSKTPKHNVRAFSASKFFIITSCTDPPASAFNNVRP